MSRLPILNAKSMERILLNLGFERVRQTGSHVFARPLLREILREIELTPDQLLDEVENL